jgi:hypothetical protein
VTLVIAEQRSEKEPIAKYRYRMKLALERYVGEPQPDDVVINDAIRWGVEHEAEARSVYELRTGMLVDQIAFIDHPDLAWCGYSPDGLIGDNGLLELKCPEPATHRANILRLAKVDESKWSSKIPLDYRRQNTLGLSVTGRDWIDWCSYDPRAIFQLGPDGEQVFDELLVIRQYRDEAEIKAMNQAIDEFNEIVDETVDEIKRFGNSKRRRS